MRLTGISMWTVYDHPKDYPDSYVARRFVAEAGWALATADVIESPLLGELRAGLAALGLTPLARNDGDDPVIVETWL